MGELCIPVATHRHIGRQPKVLRNLPPDHDRTFPREPNAPHVVGVHDRVIATVKPTRRPLRVDLEASRRTVKNVPRAIAGCRVMCVSKVQHRVPERSLDRDQGKWPLAAIYPHKSATAIAGELLGGSLVKRMPSRLQHPVKMLNLLIAEDQSRRACCQHNSLGIAIHWNGIRTLIVWSGVCTPLHPADQFFSGNRDRNTREVSTSERQDRPRAHLVIAWQQQLTCDAHVLKRQHPPTLKNSLSLELVRWRICWSVNVWNAVTIRHIVPEKLAHDWLSATKQFMDMLAVP